MVEGYILYVYVVTVNSLLPNAGVSLDPQMAPPSDVQCRLLRQVVLSAMGDRVARLDVLIL